MGVYINNKIVIQKEKEKADEFSKASMMLEIADKENKIKGLQNQNATIMLEIASLKGVK